jgi:hypothetical protein
VVAALDREETRMSIPNMGPELPDPADGNSAPMYRGNVPTDDVQAASSRASTVTNRFGGTRYALSRPPEADGGESGESE